MQAKPYVPSALPTCVQPIARISSLDILPNVLVMHLLRHHNPRLGAVQVTGAVTAPERFTNGAIIRGDELLAFLDTVTTPCTKWISVAARVVHRRREPARVISPQRLARGSTVAVALVHTLLWNV